MSDELPPNFEFTFRDSFIRFLSVKSNSIEIKTPSCHVYQTPDMFFDFLSDAWKIDDIIESVSNIDPNDRDQLISELRVVCDRYCE